MILVVCAVERELHRLRPRAGTEMLVTGVGPVEAAVATSRALAVSPPEIVINAGIAGGFHGRATVGETVAVASDALAELGLEDGSPMPPLPGGVRLVDRERSDPHLIELCRRLGIRIGTAVTVSTITTSNARADALAARFDADVEAMEGFAVLRSAAIAAIPALELRAVSNRTGPREQSGWNFNAAADALAAALDRLLDSLGKR